jgi:CDP-diacylglycerol--serine O-phosphatidyltransferase
MKKPGMKKKRQDLYFLPSLLSIISVFFGFMSIVSSLHAHYSWAAFWIILAAMMDGLDGIIARATHSASEFGTQIDSLADTFSFGAAPSILLYLWGMQNAGPSAVIFCFLYLTAGILRLARYNVMSKTPSDRRSYTGLTIPSAAMFMCSLVIFHPRALESKPETFALIIIALAIALCMISRIKYRNFLNFKLYRRIDLKTGLFIAVLVGSLIFYARVFLILFFSINVLSGPVNQLAERMDKRKPRKSDEPEGLPEKK